MRMNMSGMVDREKTPLGFGLLIAALAIVALVAACAGNESRPAPGSTATGPQASDPASTASAEPSVEPVQETTAPAPRPKGGWTASPEQPRSPQPVVADRGRTEPEAPRWTTVSVPAGTALQVEFSSELSSATGQVGQEVTARVVSDHAQDGRVVIPSGSLLSGSVTEAVSLKKIGGRAKLAVEFTTLELPSGESLPVQVALALQGKSETKKDTATIAGATAGGALLGRILKDDSKDKDKATLIGAVVGAAAGTAAAAKTKGDEVTIPAGATMTVELASPVSVRVVG
jgi:hypothetical protein